MSPRALYGGAFTVELSESESWTDVSDLRPVPDHQEVFLDHARRQLVFEIMERENVPDEQAAAHYFHDLAQAHDSRPQDTHFSLDSSPIVSFNTMSNWPEDTFVCSGRGVQKVFMGGSLELYMRENGLQYPPEGLFATIQVDLCLIRLPSVSSDILITLSSPLQATNSNEPPQQAFASIVNSFRIHRLDIFAG